MRMAMALVGGMLLSSSWLAQAALGGQADSITTDSARFHAKLSSSALPAYSVQVLTQDNGTEIKEFVAPNGIVFAVSWHGPGRPDLQQLLGEHFSSFQNEIAARPLRHTRTPFTVASTTLVVHLSGHMRDFSGSAYLPQQLPANVQLTDLR